MHHDYLVAFFQICIFINLFNFWSPMTSSSSSIYCLNIFKLFLDEKNNRMWLNSYWHTYEQAHQLNVILKIIRVSLHIKIQEWERFTNWNWWENISMYRLDTSQLVTWSPIAFSCLMIHVFVYKWQSKTIGYW